MRWFGHVEHKDDADWLKQCMKIEFEGTRQRGRLRKTWWDCVKTDMESFGLSCEDAQDDNDWRLRIKGELANPGLPVKWSLKRFDACYSNIQYYFNYFWLLFNCLC